jgi:hypothetical protein
MQEANAPTPYSVLFGSSASPTYIRTVPVTTADPNAASFTDGFPPNTFTPPGAGGAPPDGRDVNGLFLSLTQAAQYLQAGGALLFSSAFATAIGGYPKGSVLTSATNPTVLWTSTVDNNSNDPDGTESPTNWVSLGAGRMLSDTAYGTTNTYNLNFNALTNVAEIILVGAGGGGGGCAAAATGQASAGSGGGGGASIRMTIVAPAGKTIAGLLGTSAFTIFVGNGESGGSGATAGNGGQNTVLTVGGLTYTANGGGGGLGSTANSGTFGVGAGIGGNYPGYAFQTVSGVSFNAYGFTGGSGGFGIVYGPGNCTGGYGGANGEGNPGAASSFAGNAGTNSFNFGTGGSGACAVSGQGPLQGGSGSVGLAIVRQYSV